MAGWMIGWLDGWRDGGKDDVHAVFFASPKFDKSFLLLENSVITGHQVEIKVWSQKDV